MTFQAYIDHIQKKTRKTPEDFRAARPGKGLMSPDVKAGQIVAWLKEGHGLGHGHAMAIYATLEPHLGR